MSRYLTLLLILSLAGCSADQNPTQYLRWVGDSEYIPSSDSENFQPCHGEKKVGQYFHYTDGLAYEGEKKALIQLFRQQYQPVEIDQSGWIRIRFIVNCKGEAGRFRLTSSDENYQERPFNNQIVDQLLSITKELEGWKILPNTTTPADYYQYLLFKIKKGHIEKIMP